MTTPPYPITWRDGVCVNNHPITPEGVKIHRRRYGVWSWVCKKCNAEAHRRISKKRKDIRQGKQPEPTNPRGICTLDCGHTVVYSSPIPKIDEIVPCLKHEGFSSGKVVRIEYDTHKEKEVL